MSQDIGGCKIRVEILLAGSHADAAKLALIPGVSEAVQATAILGDGGSLIPIYA